MNKTEQLEVVLACNGLTEFERGRWCQSGAQASWHPDLDEKAEAVLVDEGTVHIHNGIYSQRVKEIHARALALGFKVTLLVAPATTITHLADYNAAQARKFND